MKICFFEDEKAKRFKPLTLTRPLDDLRIGLFTISEKWVSALQADGIARLLPEHLEGVFKSGEISEKEECIWLNSRFLPSDGIVEKISSLASGEKLVHNGEVVAALLEGPASAQAHADRSFSSEKLAEVTCESALSLNFIWDMISMNADQIIADLKSTNLSSYKGGGGSAGPHVQFPEQVFIDTDATIEPGCVFIAKDGPVVIQKNATIEAGSILRGPVAICEGATVKAGARISGGTTIGPVCKVGGEVSGCIFHSFSNKGHDGFTGNSIFGQWVNLGAGTNTSNLKNNYKDVEVIDWETKDRVMTQQQFLGTIMADHSKTAINTMLNTGTMCGVSSNIFVGEFPPKVIDSFTWLGPEGPMSYRFDKALEVMALVMKRRDVQLTDAYKKMMKYVVDLK